MSNNLHTMRIPTLQQLSLVENKCIPAPLQGCIAFLLLLLLFSLLTSQLHPSSCTNYRPPFHPLRVVHGCWAGDVSGIVLLCSDMRLFCGCTALVCKHTALFCGYIVLISDIYSFADIERSFVLVVCGVCAR